MDITTTEGKFVLSRLPNAAALGLLTDGEGTKLAADLRLAERAAADCAALKGAKRFGLIAGIVAVVLGLWLGIYWLVDGDGDRKVNSELVSAKSEANQLRGALVGTSNALAQADAKLPDLNSEVNRLMATNAILEAGIIAANSAANSAIADAERAERERDAAKNAATTVQAKAEADAKVTLEAAKTEAAKIVTEAKAKAEGEVARVSAEAKAKADAEAAKAVAEAQVKAKAVVSSALPPLPDPDASVGGRRVIHFVTGEPNGTYDRKGPVHPYQDALREYAKKVRAGAVRNPSGKDAFEAMAEALEAAAAGKKLTPAQMNALESARDNFTRRGLTRDASNVSAALAANQ